jgi:hypothetical protein
MQQQHSNDYPMNRLAEREGGFSLASTLAQYEVEEILPGQAARMLNAALRGQGPGECSAAADAGS